MKGRGKFEIKENLIFPVLTLAIKRGILKCSFSFLLFFPSLSENEVREREPRDLHIPQKSFLLLQLIGNGLLLSIAAGQIDQNEYIRFSYVHYARRIKTLASFKVP